MSVEQNKETSRRFVEEVFNRGNFGILDELMAPNFVEHEQLPPGIPSSHEGAVQLFSMLRSAFPDFKATIQQLIGEGDNVVIQMIWNGTQKGEFLGVPPSGKHITVPVIDILHFNGGQITEHWGLMDSMGMMQQLGAIPSPK